MFPQQRRNSGFQRRYAGEPNPPLLPALFRSNTIRKTEKGPGDVPPSSRPRAHVHVLLILFLFFFKVGARKQGTRAEMALSKRACPSPTRGVC